MSAFVEPWVTTMFSAENTVAVYRRRLHAWVVWCLGNDVPPVGAGQDDVAQYRSAIEAEGLSPSAVVARVSAVSSWSRWLIAEGHATTNPACSWTDGRSVDECDQPHYGLGFCAKHYKRFKANGDPTVVRTRPTVPFRTCTECDHHGPREDFWTDRCICRPCRPRWETRVHRARAAAGAIKWCSRCQKTRPLTDFGRNQALCKPCNKAAKNEQQALRRASGAPPIHCVGPCDQVLPPTAFDPGYRTCRRCRFDAMS